jgi:hypothetical protein
VENKNKRDMEMNGSMEAPRTSMESPFGPTEAPVRRKRPRIATLGKDDECFMKKEEVEEHIRASVSEMKGALKGERKLLTEREFWDGFYRI